jgi:1-acyl-sn-glycerol-3-phosphate acyltransferase
VKKIRVFGRLLFFVGYTLAIILEIWLKNLIFGVDLRRAMRIRRRWARRLLRVAGARVRLSGVAPDFPCVLVSNHRSYLDPILLLCHSDAFPVAKAELARWPLIGRGARLAGILYLKRESGQSRADTLRQMRDKLEAGHPVILFPEGTTSALPDTLPFRKGAFQLAAKSGFPIVPVALRFADTGDYWVGRESFLRHAWRRFQLRDTAIEVHYGPMMHDASPDVLLQGAQAWINAALEKPAPLP